MSFTENVGYLSFYRSTKHKHFISIVSSYNFFKKVWVIFESVLDIELYPGNKGRFHRF